MTVYDTAKEAGLTTLVAAIDGANMKGVFNSPLKGTVFAPTNEAFDELIEALGTTAEKLLGNKSLLRSVLKYHIVFGKPIESSDVPEDRVTLYTWTGAPLEARFNKNESKNPGVRVFYGKDFDAKAKVVGADVDAEGPAVIHVINRVMVPPS